MMRPVLLLLFLSTARALIDSCKALYALLPSTVDHTVPCLEVPSCSSDRSSSTLIIDTLSSGFGPSKSKSFVELCYDENNLHVVHKATGQTYLPQQSMYTSCNDPIYNLDVAEAFIAPFEGSGLQEGGPHCYTELDISPWNVIFESGIYNPYLNHTSLTNILLDCSSTGVTYSTTRDTKAHEWTATMAYPWSVLNCPAGCQSTANTYTCSAKRAGVYRANFYRVNELTDVSTTKCTKSVCEYMAWSPTNVDPPSFHEPKRFGYLVMV